MSDYTDDRSLLSQLDDSEKSGIISDEELEEIGVAYGSRKKYKEIMRELANLLRGNQMGRSNVYIPIGIGRNPKISSGNTTVPFGELKEIKKINIVGKTISSPHDAATLFSIFRDPRIEIFNVVYTSAAGNILAHTAWTCGLPSITASTLGNNFENTLIYNTKNKFHADKVWIAHNHPSGNPDPSSEDVITTMHYADVLKDNFAGHIVTNHKNYSVITSDGTSFLVPFKNPLKNFISSFRENALKTGPEIIANMFKKVLSTKEDVNAFSVLDNNLRVVSWLYGDSDNVINIKKYMRAVGGNSIISLTNNESFFKKYSDISESAFRTEYDIFKEIVLVSRDTGELEKSFFLERYKYAIQNNINPEKYETGKWQEYQPLNIYFLINNQSIQNELGSINTKSDTNTVSETENKYTKEKNMSDQLEDLSENTRDPKEEAFLNIIHQRKVITDAMKEGTLSCLPGTDGYADTKPAINLVNGTNYHGSNLLYLKEHQRQKEFPTAEYATFDQIKAADCFIRQGEKGVSLYISEKNENDKWESKNIRLFNIAQTDKPWQMKEYAEKKQQEEQDKKLAYFKSQYGENYQFPESRKKGPAPDIVCTSTDPEKYLGQYLAAVSMGSNFKASKEQAKEFTEKMEASLYEKIVINKEQAQNEEQTKDMDKGNDLTGNLETELQNKGHTNPFKLSKISNEASAYCKKFMTELNIESRKQNQEQKIEQQQSRGGFGR